MECCDMKSCEEVLDEPYSLRFNDIVYTVCEKCYDHFWDFVGEHLHSGKPADSRPIEVQPTGIGILPYTYPQLYPQGVPDPVDLTPRITWISDSTVAPAVGTAEINYTTGTEFTVDTGRISRVSTELEVSE